MSAPTEELYGDVQRAYSFLNSGLFGGSLPNCLITMQRKARSKGYFCSKQFISAAGNETDEIALNPTFLATQNERGLLSTLGHEMTHLWQAHFGRRRRPGYHNREWANKMIELGLYPSNTGEPGGREIGYRMTHYIVRDGRFDVVCNELLESGFRFSWLQNGTLLAHAATRTAVAMKGKTDSSNRWKYTCVKCAENAWARPDANLICGDCYAPMPHKGELK